ncbi:MAG: tetratricopeptide repeat protein [Pyrinomonadaceae bacterium]
MNSPERQIYRFENVEVDVVRGAVERSGKDLRLRQKTFQVLLFLIENRDRALSKDQIIKDVWQDTAVVDDVLVQSIKDIRRALGDDPHRPRLIRTIPKLGYRFIGELSDPSEVTKTPEHQSNRRQGTFAWARLMKQHRIMLVAAILIVVLSLSFFFIQALRRPNTEVRLAQEPGKRPVVVMFFENQAGAPEMDWLRGGLADMLIAGLLRSPSITALSRDQLHIMLQRANHDASKKVSLVDSLEIARLTGAESIITGSFARLGDKMRVEVQLYNARTGDLEATESLTVDRPEDVLTEIDMLSLRLAQRIGGSDFRPPGLVEVMTNNLQAYRYYSLGVEKAQGLQNKEAIDLLERAVDLDPEFAMAHARIGYTYAVTWGLAGQGKPHLERAFALSSRLTEKDRLNIAAWYQIANLDYANAIRSYEEIISKHPAEIEAYWRLGRLLLGEERYDDALRVLHQGLSTDTDAPDIYNALGVTYRDMGRHADAIAKTERYVQLAPKEANAYDSMALAFQAAGEYDKAQAAYERALRIDPDFDVAVLHRGNLYFQMGRYDDAIRSYEKYIRLAASDWDKAWGWGRIAVVESRRGRLREAAAAAEKEVKLDNDSFVGSLIVALESRNTARAADLQQRLLEQSPYNERGLRPSPRLLHYLRASAALESGQHEAAVRHFTQALRHRPMVWDIDSYEDCLANAFLKLGRVDEAIAEYERILKLNPNYPLARFHLAQALEQKGMASEARGNYRLFLEIWESADRDIPEVSDARRKAA